jgi:hypothetical protein
MATRPHTLTEEIEDRPFNMANYELMLEQQTVLKSNPTAEKLKELAQSEFGLIRLGVAQHPNTDTQTLWHQAARDEYKIIRQAAMNSIHSRKLAKKLEFNLYALKRA